MYCVYLLQNKFNLKVYVGCTCWFTHRMRQHKYTSKQDNQSPLYRAIKKYGWDNFTKTVIEEYETEADMLEGESFWVAFFRSNILRYGNNYGYNLSDGGENSPAGMTNKKHSQEAKDKMRQAHLGKSHDGWGHRCMQTAETAAKISASKKGRPCIPEAVEAAKLVTKGKTWKTVNGKRTWMEKI